jgi:uncharacterized membrane-anchored protein YitT (DUF2179 family)
MPGRARTLLVIALLYLFLVGVRLLEGGIKGLSGGTDSRVKNQDGQSWFLILGSP